ncbi:hypothetical protein B296_00051869 [Ensete ventricosum]|uniref:Uncharacterized protein n=1 Tax=Ensete ventricosum TaxID=4639 RepID=A0A426YEX7_ENSVE|nr:hypothetical protein B296_00051869 [Ensete ventricosum]
MVADDNGREEQRWPMERGSDCCGNRLKSRGRRRLLQLLRGGRAAAARPIAGDCTTSTKVAWVGHDNG